MWGVVCGCGASSHITLLPATNPSVAPKFHLCHAPLFLPGLLIKSSQATFGIYIMSINHLRWLITSPLSLKLREREGAADQWRARLLPRQQPPHRLGQNVSLIGYDGRSEAFPPRSANHRRYICNAATWLAERGCNSSERQKTSFSGWFIRRHDWNKIIISYDLLIWRENMFI